VCRQLLQIHDVAIGQHLDLVEARQGRDARPRAGTRICAAVMMASPRSAGFASRSKLAFYLAVPLHD
jgi:hypothetical protein